MQVREMGFLDKFSKKVANKVENKVADKVANKVVNSAGKALDGKKSAKKSQGTEKRSQSSKKASGDALTDKRRCPKCGEVTKNKFCGECGADLSKEPFLTQDEFDAYIKDM
jgi:hypothetical protein